MTASNNLPFEVGCERVKQNLIRMINQAAEEEDMPSSIMILILENIIQELKLNVYSTIIGNYDMSIPAGVEDSNSIPMQKNDEKVSVDMTPKEIKNGSISTVKDSTPKT